MEGREGVAAAATTPHPCTDAESCIPLVAVGPQGAPPEAQFPMPENEADRLQLLQCLNVLGVQIDQFTPLVREAARLFATPISVISMVDSGRQWFTAKKGLDVDETDRASAFCAHAIMPEAPVPFVVPDTLRDPRFVENALVTGPPYIRFYCGMPIYVGGIKLGTVCVIDTRTRTFLRTDFIRVVNALGQLSRLISGMLVRRARPPDPMQSDLISRIAANSGPGGRQAINMSDPAAVASLDVPLSSIDVNSPLYRAFGLGLSQSPALGAGPDSWLKFSDADFAVLVGQLLELVDASYVQVASVQTPATVAQDVTTRSSSIPTTLRFTGEIFERLLVLCRWIRRRSRGCRSFGRTKGRGWSRSSTTSGRRWRPRPRRATPERTACMRS